jgi:hypothetical protein
MFTVINDPKFFCFIFLLIQKMQNFTVVQIRLNNWKKCKQEKLFARNFVKETRGQGDKGTNTLCTMFNYFGL